MKKYLLMLWMAVAMVFATGSTVEAKTMTVTVKKADTSTLKKVNAHLKKGKKFYLKVKGSKSGSKKLIKSVSTKIGEINGYDVRFNYSSQKKSTKGYYRFTVSANNAKLYRDTVKLLADMYTNEYEYTTVEVVDGVLVWVERTTTTKADFGNKRFCDLSTLIQSEVIASHFNDHTSKYITYDMKYRGCTNKYSDAKIVSKLLNGTMAGVCHDFTNSQIVVLEQINIPAYYAIGTSQAGSHAMPVVKVKNSNGKTMWVAYDYGASWTFSQVKANPQEQGVYSYFAGTDWVLKTEWYEDDNKNTKSAYNSTWDRNTDWN